MPTVPLGQR